jgi:hypothetical protein
VLVVAGGLGAGDEFLATTEVLVAGSPAWAPAGRLPSARSSLRGASLGKQLYMAGGWIAHGDSTCEVLEFNTTSYEWEASPPMEEKRAGPGMAAVPYSAVQRFCPDW